MSKDSRFGMDSVSLDVGLGREPAAERVARPRDDDPFRILILGNFSGQGRVAKPVQVDRDNFDDVLRAFAPVVDVTGGRIAIGEIDDFHPDRLLARYPALREAPAAAVSAAAALAAPTTAAVSAASLASGSFLDDVLEASEKREQPKGDALSGWINQVVSKHVVASPSAEEQTQQAAAEQTTADRVRAVLHAPAFQAMEALWRGVYWLVRNTDTDGPVSIWLVDSTREAVAAACASAAALEDLPGYAAVRARRPAVLVAAFDFGVSDGDLVTLAGLGALASAFSVSCLAGARPEWIGCDSYAELDSPRNWAATREEAEMFRSTAAANHIGLAGPRVLLRMPYGAKSDACESVALEETPAHEQMLWGNAALVCASLMAASFNEDRWDMRPGTRSQVDGLPVYVRDGEAQPCAETLMTEHTASAMLDRGVMAVASVRNSDAVKVVRFQNAAAPGAQLPGPWLP
ncbi:MAG: hypothetical protein FJW31_10345 [Acidobacteria bacterium]|nr:hypothetical protein [Acidobacteriota bacterium]